MHRLEAVDRLTADALSGESGVRSPGARPQGQQFTVKLIVLPIADRRLYLDIISSVMPTNLTANSAPLLW